MNEPVGIRCLIRLGLIRCGFVRSETLEIGFDTDSSGISHGRR